HVPRRRRAPRRPAPRAHRRGRPQPHQPSAVAGGTLPLPLPPRRAGGGDSMITGAGQIIRLVLRRDRARLAGWVLVLSTLPAGVVAATETGYPTEADRIAFAEHAAVNPAELATRGPVFAPTVGGLVAWTLVSSVALVS